VHEQHLWIWIRANIIAHLSIAALASASELALVSLSDAWQEPGIVASVVAVGFSNIAIYLAPPDSTVPRRRARGGAARPPR
jgi:hypothetical protein